MMNVHRRACYGVQLRGCNVPNVAKNVMKRNAHDNRACSSVQFGGCSAPNTMKNEGGKRTSIITVERSKACSEGDVICKEYCKECNEKAHCTCRAC